MQNKALEVYVKQAEYIYDDRGTNAMNFITDDGYFCIQRGVFIETDEAPMYSKPYIELNEQNGTYCDFLEVLFSENKVFIALEKDFLDYRQVTVNMTENIDLKTIDFFVNHLYLGDVVKYAEDIDKAMQIEQTIFPEEI
ncbi:MAG: hypothetical protein FWD48_00425 [Oscillospiraceae bacterium]|nr:hypothetical protein [Oscillospiraceae bacterium]